MEDILKLKEKIKFFEYFECFGKYNEGIFEIFESILKHDSIISSKLKKKEKRISKNNFSNLFGLFDSSNKNHFEDVIDYE